MMRHTETAPHGETASASLRTLCFVAIGAVLAVGAAYCVRPSPKLDAQEAVVAPVVPAAVLAVGAPKPTPDPAPQPVSAPAAPTQPALSPERQQLAKLMNQTPAPTTPAPAPTPAAPTPVRSPEPPEVRTTVGPQVSSFAPEPDRPGAMQALAALAPPRSPAAAEEEQKKRMAEDAAKAIRDGDIATARAILEKSLAAGDQVAALALAETYDPVVLAAMKLEGAEADPAKARELYEKARSAGIGEARKRLVALKRYERRH